MIACLEIVFKLLFKNESICQSTSSIIRTKTPNKYYTLTTESTKNTQMAVTFNAFLSCNLAFPFQTFYSRHSESTKSFNNSCGDFKHFTEITIKN